MTSYLTLVVVGDRVGEATKTALMDYRADLDLKPRPRVGMGLREGLFVLLFEDASQRDDFLAALLRARQNRQVIAAFCNIRSRYLKGLHLAVFEVSGVLLEVRWQGLMEPQTRSLKTPYFRRLLEFRSIDAAEISGRKPIRIQSVATFAPEELIYTEPQLVRFPAEHLRGLWNADLLTTSDVCLLPPFRASHELVGYFDEQHSTLRDLLARWLVDIRLLSVWIPSGVVLWQLSNDLLYQDVLIDGGALQISCEDRKPTQLYLTFCDGDGDLLVMWRHTFLTRADDPRLGPMWIRPIAEAVNSDLCEPTDAVSVAVLPHESKASTKWEVAPRAQDYEYGVRDEDIWQNIETLAALLGEFQSRLASRESSAASGGALRVITEWILDGSRGREWYRNDGRAEMSSADNDYAEERFEHHLWRKPFPPQTSSDPTDSWRNASRHVMKYLSKQQELRPDSLFPGHDCVSLPRLANDLTRPATVLHSPNEETFTRLRWRLLLPVGSVLKPVGTNVLDDLNTILDQELRID